ncbi:MAG: KpsF/GutQ family sugar-phosphate isomerase [Bryobacteraceae bacterium]|jgi:arabinose-5-phosphate isomerase
MPSPDTDFVACGRAAMEAEAEAIASAARRLDAQFSRAVELILQHGGKVVVTGIGKSGRVAQKLVATLSSTGTPAVFLHPAEAVHGDLGVYASGDPTIMISKSGATAELLRLVGVLRDFRSPLIGILGNTSSPLASAVDIVLDASVRAEADLHNLAPTSSAAVALALGDALAVAVMQGRRFTPEDFAVYHPAGQLGRNLELAVGEVMHGPGDTAWAKPGDSLRAVVIAMTRHPLGAACVIDEEGRLAGLITDGDLRRALEKHDDIRQLCAAQIMTPTPTLIGPEARLHEALRLMEDRPSQIYVLPVVDPVTRRCLGLLRLHDIYHARPPA